MATHYRRDGDNPPLLTSNERERELKINSNFIILCGHSRGKVRFPAI